MEQYVPHEVAPLEQFVSVIFGDVPYFQGIRGVFQSSEIEEIMGFVGEIGQKAA